jgi:hypothetical protein
VVWRIHFTAEDLARTRVDASMGPSAETMLSLAMLRDPARRPAAFGGWRERMRVRRELTPRIRPLASLIPPGSRGFDLYTLIGPTATIDEGVAALLAMPSGKVRAERPSSAANAGYPAGRGTWPTGAANSVRRSLPRCARATGC